MENVPAIEDLPRLYIAVRADLAPGPQLAQSVHAALEFAVAHPRLVRDWRYSSNFFIGVTVRDELALLELENSAKAAELKHHLVREPDYNHQATAIALEPGTVAQKLCAEYPLALKGLRERAMA